MSRCTRCRRSITNNMEEYYYRIYGLTVKTNVPLTLLAETDAAPEDLSIRVEYGAVQKSYDIRVLEDDGVYRVNLGMLADYRIYPERGLMECTAEDYNGFFSTLFNIPFSIFFAVRSLRLLHCCAMTYKEKLICLAGEKGVGKSTVTSILDGGDFRLFSDDSLLISDDGRGYKPHNLIKMTESTVKFSRKNAIMLTDCFNAVGKRYGVFDGEEESRDIAAVLVLRRTSGTPDLREVTGETVRRMSFLNNTIGISYFPRELLRKWLDAPACPSVKLYDAFIPNDYENLEENVCGLERMIKEIF